MIVLKYNVFLNFLLKLSVYFQATLVDAILFVCCICQDFGLTKQFFNKIILLKSDKNYVVWIFFSIRFCILLEIKNKYL